MRLTTSLNHRQRLIGNVNSVFSSAFFGEYTHQQLTQALIRVMYEDYAWKRVPQWVRSYVQGYSDSTRRHFERANIEHSYVIDGERLLLSDPKYKAYPPRDVDTTTGAMAYKKSKKVYFK